MNECLLRKIVHLYLLIYCSYVLTHFHCPQSMISPNPDKLILFWLNNNKNGGGKKKKSQTAYLSAMENIKVVSDFFFLT